MKLGHFLVGVLFSFAGSFFEPKRNNAQYMKKILALLFAGAYILIANPQGAFGQNATMAWVKTWGGINQDQPEGFARDTAGNLFVAGYISDVADFDPGPGTHLLPFRGGNDIAIGKYDPNGNLLWAHSLGSYGTDMAYDVAVDEAGNSYYTGQFYDVVDFDPGPATFNLTSGGNFDAFMLKLDPAGNFVWARKFSGAFNLRGVALRIDDFGSVISTGYFQGPADFDPGAGVFTMNTGTDFDVYVSKLDANGSFIWAKTLSGPGVSDNPRDLVVDSNNDIYITGDFGATVDFDPGPGTYNIPCAGIRDIFLLKLSPNGNLVWVKTWGGTGNDKGLALGIDPDGFALVVGNFYNTVDFDPGAGVSSLSAVGATMDAFISKLDTSGNFVWAKRVGANSNESIYTIQVGPGGNIFSGGNMRDSIDIDPGTNESMVYATTYGYYFVKLDPSGDLICGEFFDSLGSGRILLDEFGNVYSSGLFRDSIDFDPGPGLDRRVSNGIMDMYLLKMDLACGSPLSIGFNGPWAALTTEKDVRISWGISNDLMINGMFIQKKTVDGDFITIGSSRYHGQGSYEFLDNNPDIGANVYRILLVDLNGHFSESDEVEAILAEDKTRMIYPNPTSQEFSIHGRDWEQLEVFDISGKLVLSQALDPNESHHVITFGKPGIYYSRLRSKERVIVETLVIR